MLRRQEFHFSRRGERGSERASKGPRVFQLTRGKAEPRELQASGLSAALGRSALQGLLFSQRSSELFICLLSEFGGPNPFAFWSPASPACDPGPLLPSVTPSSPFTTKEGEDESLCLLQVDRGELGVN